MSAAATRMSRDEFLAWEAQQEVKHEFDGAFPVAMAGGTRAHARIQRNLAISVGGRLRGTRCEFLGSDLKVGVQRSIRYPDGFVVCSAGENHGTVVDDPVVVFEVLSPSTASTDLITKSREYAETPSVQRYIVITQDRIGATVFERVGTDWVGRVVAPGAVLAMPEIGIEVPLAELYDGLGIVPDGDATI